LKPIFIHFARGDLARESSTNLLKASQNSLPSLPW
jgi:hypothetical protein